MFIEFFPAFKKYETYVVRFDDGMHLLEQMRKERMVGFLNPTLESSLIVCAQGIRSAEAAAK